MRHFTRLSQLNFSIDTHFYPLGSCTMKYNPKACNQYAMLPELLNRQQVKEMVDRVAQTSMKLGDAAKLVLLSFDSTLRSNLSVGLPIDMLTYETDTLKLEHTKRIGQDDPYFKMLSGEWSKALRAAFQNIEAFDI